MSIINAKVFFVFFQNATNPSFFFYVGLCHVKENMQHMTSGTRTINRSHQPCVDVTPPPRVRTITRVAGAGGRRSNKERQRLQSLASIGLHTTFTGIHICYIDIPQWVLTCHLRTFFFFFLSSLRFLPPGVGLTGSSRPSKVFEDWAQTNASKRRRVGLHRTNSDWSRGYIAFRLKTGSALIAVWKGTASCSTF